MASTRYVALLRGINVGGRNKIAMTDLRATLTDRFDAVETFIQSGNVLFETAEPRAGLEATIEAILEDRFGVPIVTIVRSHTQLQAAVTSAPEGFGARPDTYHSDAVFLKAPLTAAKAIGAVRAVGPREGVDQAWAGKGVLYLARLSAKRTQSRLSRIASRPEYQLMTIRTWSTTTKLLALLDGRAAKPADREA